MFFYYFCVFLFSSTCLFGISPIKIDEWKKHRLNAIDHIYNTYLVNYAPIHMKSVQLKCNFDQEVYRAKQCVIKMKIESDSEFHVIVRRLLESLKDYHVGVKFYSTEAARLPFDFVGAQGKFYFAWIHPEFIKHVPTFPFAVGDEILMFGSEPIASVVNSLRARDDSQGLEATDLSIATRWVTKRFGNEGYVVPKGPVALMGRKQGTSTYAQTTVDWSYTTEKFKSECVAPVATQLEMAAGPDSFHVMGAYRSFIPDLGDVTWEGDPKDLFFSYICTLPSGKRVGYLRIPTYKPQDCEKSVTEFGERIRQFEEMTDMLVIDQVNNLGGRVLYVYALLRHLTERPLVVPKHQLMITQADVDMGMYYCAKSRSLKSNQDAYRALVKEADGYPADLQLADYFQQYGELLMQEWAEGHRFTEPLPLYGIEEIPPAPIGERYTKPIVVLVNELDFSGGDFFPAILQDNRRALIFGTKTAGAGGFFSSYEFPNLTGIWSFQLTRSLAVRPDGTWIENTGVAPDVECQLTPHDLEFGYAEYVAKLISVLESLE